MAKFFRKKLIGTYLYNHATHYILDGADLVSICKNYGGDKFKHFFYFCKGWNLLERPNCDMLRFNCDPKTGEVIDWSRIYEEHKHDFDGFSQELDAKFYSENTEDVQTMIEREIREGLKDGSVCQTSDGSLMTVE